MVLYLPLLIIFSACFAFTSKTLASRRFQRDITSDKDTEHHFKGVPAVFELRLFSNLFDKLLFTTLFPPVSSIEQKLPEHQVFGRLQLSLFVDVIQCIRCSLFLQEQEHY